MTRRPLDPGRVFLASAAAIALWLLGVFLRHFTFATGRQLPHILFLDQDFAALLILLFGLALLAPLARGRPWHLPPPNARTILALILLAALIGWAGERLVFHGYALSRDEEVANFAAAYLREGMIGRPIPAEWLDFRRAIMPEFFSPYGADAYWTAAYLPVNSAIRALFWRLGDPSLASPVLLAIGLIALWRVALRLFPGRPDAVWVVMLMALASAQLSVTAMTPYAMTGHFALNMLWLALFLRGGWAGHLGAGLTAILAAGLHQWHFPPLFLAPFLLWMLLQRRWGALLFHTLVIAALVLIWAKLYPAWLLDHLGPPADIRPAAGVADKVGSLFSRVADKWQPLFNISRFLAWNNILLLPLALIGVAAAGWRNLLTGGTLVLPLALGCALSFALALYQGYGWGFRYAHGFIGSFCLLAGYGWLRLGAPSLRPVILATGVSLAAALFLMWRAHDYVAPYAAGYRLMRAAEADVVLLDPRGALFATDMVRSDGDPTHPPVIMNLAMLRHADVTALCKRRTVLLVDRTAFRALGIRPAKWQNNHVSRLREQMAAVGCGNRIVPIP